jgi:hypothetical protein
MLISIKFIYDLLKKNWENIFIDLWCELFIHLISVFLYEKYPSFYIHILISEVLEINKIFFLFLILTKLIKYIKILFTLFFWLKYRVKISSKNMESKNW